MTAFSLNGYNGGHGYIASYGDGTAVSAGAQNATVWNAVGAGLNRSVVQGTSGRACFVDTGAAFTDPNFYRYRGFVPFDLSTLLGATVNSATLRIYFIAARTSTIGGTIYVVGSNQASLSALATSDYTLIGSTSFCDTHPLVSAPTLSAYYDFTLNAAALAAISSGSIKGFCLVHSLDFSNTSPARGPFGGPSNTDEINMQYASGANPPILTGDYTPASGGGMRRRASGLLAPARFVR